VLASRIIRNHPLPDGNKRVALILMDLYLEENGYKLTASPQEIDQMFRAVAAREHSEDYFMDWLISRTERHGQENPGTSGIRQREGPHKYGALTRAPHTGRAALRDSDPRAAGGGFEPP
jgi:fido (protein-threonine AMPylation protein)